MLRVDNISASYGRIRALENVSLEVPRGGIVCLLGSNGAGKTTTLNCISSVVPLTRGSISLNGNPLTGLSCDRIVSLGVVQVPEGREIFPELSVRDNIRLGAWVRRGKTSELQADFDRVYSIFPRLRERHRQMAGTLSGGEQQMLMFARALMAHPKVILLDEPSLGLSPVLVDVMFDVIRQLHAEGYTFLIVEQNARIALEVSDYGYVLDNGEVRLQGASIELAGHPDVQAAYLGS